MSAARDITYKIEIYEDGSRKFYLGDDPMDYINPSKIKIGSIIRFDPNGAPKTGIVTNIRKGIFTYYDVGFMESLGLEEVAEFQVFEVVGD